MLEHIIRGNSWRCQPSPLMATCRLEVFGYQPACMKCCARQRLHPTATSISGHWSSHAMSQLDAKCSLSAALARQLLFLCLGQADIGPLSDCHPSDICWQAFQPLAGSTESSGTVIAYFLQCLSASAHEAAQPGLWRPSHVHREHMCTEAGTDPVPCCQVLKCIWPNAM